MIDCAARHREALAKPLPGFERAIVTLVTGLTEYADAHRQQYGGTVRNDGVIGEYWHWLGEALIGLLNGETGRLDCGTLDGLIRGLIDSPAEAGDTAAARAALAPEAAAAPELEPRPAARQAHSLDNIGRRRLTDRQRELIARVRVDGNVANYAPDERIPDWGELKSTMLALGGKWRSRKGFVFPDDLDAAERVRLAAETGEIFDPRAASFFPTPAGLADELVRRLRLEPGQLVLEPSAGRGALALAARRACPEARIACIEALPDNVAELERLGFLVQRADFLTEDVAPLFDAVVMNPPFERRADIAHVRHALGCLKPGGRLAAIMSAGVKYREDLIAAEFRALVAANQGEIIDNAEGAFVESGTGVRTVTVAMRAPLEKSTARPSNLVARISATA